MTRVCGLTSHQGSRGSRPSVAFRFAASICFIVVLVLVGAAYSAPAQAHADLIEERTTPPPDALLAAPPETFELWFTERVASDPEPPSIRVLDQSGRELRTTSVTIDPNDTHHVTAQVDGVASGTYTMVWSVLSADDGHTLTGTYGFRVGPGRAPGAASVEGERPRAWAVATRWLTFFGGGVAAASMIWIAYSGITDPEARRRRRLKVGIVAAVVGLIATLLEPLLQTRFPPDGVDKPSLSEAISSLPDAWWLRPAGLTTAIVAVAGALLLRKPDRWLRDLGIAGAVGGLTAILGLSLTTHVAARDSWSILSKASVIIHEWSVGLWVGGLVVLALAWPRGVQSDDGQARKDPIRQFSRAALVLAPLGILTGIINSGLTLPSVSSLWESDYGRVLIAKILVLVPVMLLATMHRVWLKQHAVRIGNALRSSVRAETAIAAVVVLGGAILALSAPPTESKGEIAGIDLAAPLAGNESAAELLHLVISPVRAGENEMTVRVSLRAPESAGEVLPVDLVRIDSISLNHEADQRGIELVRDATGDFVSTGVQLSLDGWWEIDVLVRRPGIEDAVVPFFFLVPDPNINGFDAPNAENSSAEAEQLFTSALELETSLTSVHYTERLTDGLGSVVTADRVVSAGTATDPPTSLLIGEQIELLTIGDRTWQRTPGGDWIEREYIEAYPPSEWGASYAGATDFALGRRVLVGDASARIVTFFVPENERQIAAWYAWWIDEETGRLVHETMVSRLHYMRWRYFDFNEPVVIPVPGTEATPVASPAASPVPG